MQVLTLYWNTGFTAFQNFFESVTICNLVCSEFPVRYLLPNLEFNIIAVGFRDSVPVGEASRGDRGDQGKSSIWQL